MQLTRQHFQLIAETIRDTVLTLEAEAPETHPAHAPAPVSIAQVEAALVRIFSDACAITNGRFDAGRFADVATGRRVR